MKWSFDNQYLASGGNDNKVLIWDTQRPAPLAKLASHCAAVKALAWNPHQYGVLATGGGTADRTIKLWNMNNFECIKNIDTGSQVCNLIFSKTVNELVSTHGYSLNQIILWKITNMHSSVPSNPPVFTNIATLTGHTYRVLYLSMSPDSTTIVTGAGDETLRFWNVFPPKTPKIGGQSFSTLFPCSIR